MCLLQHALRMPMYPPFPVTSIILMVCLTLFKLSYRSPPEVHVFFVKRCCFYFLGRWVFQMMPMIVLCFFEFSLSSSFFVVLPFVNTGWVIIRPTQIFLLVNQIQKKIVDKSRSEQWGHLTLLIPLTLESILQNPLKVKVFFKNLYHYFWLRIRERDHLRPEIEVLIC